MLRQRAKLLGGKLPRRLCVLWRSQPKYDVLLHAGDAKRWCRLDLRDCVAAESPRRMRTRSEPRARESHLISGGEGTEWDPPLLLAMLLTQGAVLHVWCLNLVWKLRLEECLTVGAEGISAPVKTSRVSALEEYFLGNLLSCHVVAPQCAVRSFSLLGIDQTVFLQAFRCRNGGNSASASSSLATLPRRPGPYSCASVLMCNIRGNVDD